MRKLLKRWYVWLALFLLLGLAASAGLIYSSRGRITQANFERIQNGMTEKEVTEILGEPDPHSVRIMFFGGDSRFRDYWRNGPNWDSPTFR